MSWLDEIQAIGDAFANQPARCDICGEQPAEAGHTHCDAIDCALMCWECGPDARDDARDQAALDHQRDK